MKTRRNLLKKVCAAALAGFVVLTSMPMMMARATETKEQPNGVLTIESSAQGHVGFQLKESFQEAELTMDFCFNTENNMTHNWEGLYVSPYCVEYDKAFAAVVLQPHLSIVNAQANQSNASMLNYSLKTGTWYRMKAEANGSKISYKVWNREEQEPSEWLQEHSYAMAGDGTLSVYSYQQNAGSHISVSFDNIKLIENGGERTFAEDFTSGEESTFFEKVNLIQDGSNTSDKLVEIREDETQQSHATGIASMEEKEITIRRGIGLERAPHPQTVCVTLESGLQVDTPVLWNMEEYDPELAEEQVITGVLVPEAQYGMEIKEQDVPRLKVISRPVQKELYVSPKGSDSNDGSIDRPFLTVERARQEVRKFNSSMTGDILVYLREGTYPITEPLNFDTEDSGSNGFYVVYQNYQDELPEISGGQVLDAVWEKDPERPGIYKTHLERERKLRSLYVNGEPAQITELTVRGQGTVGRMTITGNEFWAETAGTTWTGIRLRKADVSVYANPEDVEIRQSRVWNSDTVGIQNIYEDGDYIIFEPQQPYGAIFSTMAWNCNLIGTADITIRNTLENLKNPGEFYFDREAQTLYYYPPKGADIDDMEFIIPESEGLMRITGESLDNRIENIEFSGIKFSYDHYNLEVIDDPENNMHAVGYGGVQSLGLYRKFSDHGNWHHSWYNTVDTPYAAVDVQSAKGIIFEGNRFINLSSSCAVSFTNDVVDSTIQGNAFINIAGNATNIGHPQHVYIGEDEHVDQQRFPVGVEGLCKNDQVVYNLVRNVSSEFYQCDAIMAFFVENCDFSHNDVANVPYTTICVGWGWWNFNGEADSEVPGNRTLTAKKNRILFNKLGDSHHVLPGDGGTVYTLGYQPDSIIAYNYIYDGPRSIYLDEGTEGFMVHDNVIQDSWDVWLYIWMQNGKIRGNVMYDNYVTNRSVHNNWPQGNPVSDTHVETQLWSEPAQNIIDNAGLKGTYTALYELLNVDAGALEKEIARANNLSEEAYDRISWNHLEQVLAEAEEGLENAEALTQGMVDLLCRRLTRAMDQLKGREENLLPYEVSDFQVKEEKGDLVLTWKKPDQEVDHYILLGLGEGVEISKEDEQYVIRNAEPGKIYVLTLCAVSTEGKCSLGASKVFSTNDYTKLPEESLFWISAGENVTTDDQGRVSAWGNIGDTTTSAVQAEEKAQPILVENAYGGQPVIRFDGVDDTMSFELDMDGKKAVTMIAVSAYRGSETGTGDKNCLIYFDEDGSWGKTFISPLADSVSWRYGTGQSDNNNVYQREKGVENQFTVSAVVKDGAEEILYVDGKKALVGIDKRDALANNTAIGQLCTYYFGNMFHYAQYDLAELMIFDRALTSEEIGNIQAYLNLKYETNLKKIAGCVNIAQPTYGAEQLQLPQMPKGIQIQIASSDKEDIIGLDGAISWPKETETVNVTCRLTNRLTGETFVTKAVGIKLAVKDDDKTDQNHNGTEGDKKPSVEEDKTGDKNTAPTTGDAMPVVEIAMLVLAFVGACLLLVHKKRAQIRVHLSETLRKR